MRNREIGYALMRATFGVIFVTTGSAKFLGGPGNFVSGMNQRFSGKLPAAMVMPFAYAIPFCEVTAGALILLGFEPGLRPSSFGRRPRVGFTPISMITSLND